MEILTIKETNEIPKLIIDLGTLFETGDYSDCRLIVGKEEFLVHKNILASRCKYFYDLFNNSKETRFYFLDKDPKYFKIILNYFYSGKIDIQKRNAFELMKLAGHLGANRIKEYCGEIVKGYINYETVFEIFEESKSFDFQELLLFCRTFIEVNAKKLFKGKAFLNLKKETLIEILSSDRIQLSELEIFFKVIEWGRFQTEGKENLEKDYLFDYLKSESLIKSLKLLLNDIFEKIRFPILTPQEVNDYVEYSKIVNDDLILEAYRSHALHSSDFGLTNPRSKIREGILFYGSGIYENLPLESLNGWNCVYKKPYSDKTNESIFDSKILNSKKILIGARAVNSPSLLLAAMGRSNKILQQTNDNETIKENGVFWYFRKNHSFGFSDTENIHLGSADLLEGKFKLSWHLTGRGGYRIGEIKNLNDSEMFEKLIFISD